MLETIVFFVLLWIVISHEHAKDRKIMLAMMDELKEIKFRTGK